MEKPCKECGKVFSKPVSVSRADWPKRMYCSKACKYDAMRGRPNPKIGDALRGKPQAPEHAAARAARIRETYATGNVKHARANLGRRGAETSQWKGDEIGYRAAHVRLYTDRGKPRQCELCGTEVGPFEWALRQEAAVVKLEVGGRFAGKSYSTRLDDYMPACKPCHREYDGRERDPYNGRYI